MYRLIILTIAGFLLTVSLATTQAQTTENLILNEISPWPSDDTAWVEILNPSAEPVPLEGWSIEFISGFSFSFPKDAGEIPSGGLHVLRISPPNPLDPDTDGCTLIGPDGPADAITWGTNPDISAIELPAGSPLTPGYESLSENQNLYEPGDVLLRVPDSWHSDEISYIGSQNWAWRHSNSASPGNPNPFPGPWLMLPYDGATIASDFSLGVSGMEKASAITFQVASDNAFTNIIFEETVEGNSFPIEEIPPGEYFWRVKALGPDGAPLSSWSAHQSFTRENFDIDELIATTEPMSAIPAETRIAQHKGGGWSLPGWQNLGMLTINHVVQQKDTTMVCLDGCRMDGRFAWDVAHPYGVMEGGHNNQYCVRACLAMIARQDGCTMSQDRLTYYIFEELGNQSLDAIETGHIGDPYGDLGHGQGAYCSDMAKTLDWIYNQPTGSSVVRVTSDEIYTNTTTAKDSIVEFIDDDRPVAFCDSKHTRLIDGHVTIFKENVGFEYIHIQDPWYSGTGAQTWEVFSPETGDEFVFPPTTGRPSRNQETSVTTDSDGDGLCDFDEIKRFHTLPDDDDTDGDGLDDQTDMLEYLFLPSGVYSPRNRDIDGDGLPKELDEDNDDPTNRSSNDGCEDANGDGFFDITAWETDNFQPGDDYDFINPDCLRGFIRVEYIFNIHEQGINIDHLWLEQITIENGDLTGTEFVHEHKWERSMNGSFPELSWTFNQEDNDEGLASARLDNDPDTGEYFLITETDTEWRDYEITHEVIPMAMMWSNVGPSYFYFAGGSQHPLGVPRDVNGGLLLEDVWCPEETVSDHGRIQVTWQIWVTPPSQ